MSFKFTPHAYKDNVFKSCLFLNVEDLLVYLNKSEFVKQICGIDVDLKDVVRSDLKIEECSPFNVQANRYTHALYVKDLLIGYTNLDALYDSFQNSELQAKADSSEVADILDFAKDTTCESELFRSFPHLQVNGLNKDKGFFIAGQRYSIHQWLDRLFTSGVQVDKAEFSIQFHDICVTLDPVPNQDTIEHPVWSTEFPAIYTKFLVMLSALNELNAESVAVESELAEC